MAEVKPACDLTFDHVYTGNAGQTTEIMVLGEAQGVVSVVVDQTVQVNLTVAEFNSLMIVGDQSTPGVGYPGVTLSWMGISPKLNVVYDKFVLVDNGSSGVLFDDDALAQKDTLQKAFSSLTFSFGASALDSIPIEAVKSINYSLPITVENSSAAGVTMLASPLVAESSLLGAQIVCPSSYSGDSSSREGAARSLFLQALAADRYKQASAPATGSQATSGATGLGFNFQLNDSITVYTTLNLTKTRKFVPDLDDFVGTAPGGDNKFAIDGSNVVIGDGDLDDDQYSSDPLPYTIAWKLVAATA